MSTVIERSGFAADKLEAAILTAKRQGFFIRRQWLDGECGGWCEVGGRKLLILDISLPLTDQLDIVNQAMLEAGALA